MRTELLHGDCLELMQDIPDGSIDLVLADPPYGTTQCKWDSIIPLNLMWEQLKRVTKPNAAIVMTAGQPFTTELISSNRGMFKYCWYWNKKMPTGFLNANKQPLRLIEEICVFYREQANYIPIMDIRGIPRTKNGAGNSDVYGNYEALPKRGNEYYPTQYLEISNAKQAGKVHPTQKPVALMEYMIKTYTNEGETVLDFCMGSGTTGVAAVNLGRGFIGIEKDSGYYDIAVSRIAEAERIARIPDLFGQRTQDMAKG